MKKVITSLIYLVIIPLLIYLCYSLYSLKQYHLFSLIIVFLTLLAFFISFENKKITVEKMVLIASFVAICTLSRILFNIIPILPGFNPVSAIIILIAIIFGRDVGFMVGSLTAFISNNYLGHGPWTVFQMFSWGIIGYLSGIFSKVLKKNKIILIIFGVFCGLFYSLLMDVYSVLSFDKVFNIKRFFVFASLSLPFTISYVIANVIFLILFSFGFLERLERIIKKYQIY